MSNSWLDYQTTSNSFKQSYIKEFLDISGDVYIRNGNINGINTDISMNGTLTCNSLTLTESTGAGINSDVQTALDGKQDALITGSGISLVGDTLNVASSTSNIVNNQSVTYTNSITSNVLSWSNYLTTSTHNEFGFQSVTMSGDGNTVVASLTYTGEGTSNPNGGASILKTDDNGLTWVNKGSSPQIVGLQGTKLGASNGGMKMSYDGNTIMLWTNNYYYGSSIRYYGYCIIYKFNGTSWVQKGQIIAGARDDLVNGNWIRAPQGDSVANGNWGGSIGISKSANTIFLSVGVPNTQIRVWDYNETSGLWIVRSNLYASMNSSWGMSSGYYFGSHEGYSGMANDGNTLVISAPYGGTNNNGFGVIVLDYISGNWVTRPKITQNITGFGSQVSISEDGTLLLIAINFSRKAAVYYWNGSTWTQRGGNFGPSTNNLYFGSRAHIMNDGKYIFITSQTQYVYVYYLSNGIYYQMANTPLNIGGNSIILMHCAQDVVRCVVNYLGNVNGQITILEIPSTVSSNTTAISGNLDISGNLNVSGGDIIVNGSTVHYSDIRLKSNIEVLQNSLNNISKLNPEIYNKKKTINEQLTLTNTESGFIAQDIWYNVPELRHLVVLPDGVTAEDIQDMSFNRVKPKWIDMYDISTNGIIDVLRNQIIHTNEDGTITYEDIIDPNDYTDKTPDYEAYGWSNKPASINYEGLIAYLVGAIQELKEKITIQSSEIDNSVG